TAPAIRRIGALLAPNRPRANLADGRICANAQLQRMRLPVAVNRRAVKGSRAPGPRHCKVVAHADDRARVRSIMLSPEELERYARHIVLHEVGGPGQQALKRARVLVIGAGGLGAPALLYLAAAGVGTLGVIDDDAVALSNLQRQVIHGTPEIGTAKVES